MSAAVCFCSFLSRTALQLSIQSRALFPQLAKDPQAMPPIIFITDEITSPSNQEAIKDVTCSTIMRARTTSLASFSYFCVVQMKSIVRVCYFATQCLKLIKGLALFMCYADIFPLLLHSSPHIRCQNAQHIAGEMDVVSTRIKTVKWRFF